MEDVPPSYESAINRDVWTVIAPWIPSNDLCAASLVSRRWHTIFAPFLWGDPASHFGTQNDAVYVALTRFKRTLKRARLSVRQLTHTLHLPPALSEIYGGPNAFWLRDVLDYLPNLQSLLVSRLPFFDHHSLIALKGRPQPRDEADEEQLTTYGLKLLIATKEPNTTSAGLAEALSHFTNLVYLDLSYTTPARDAAVLFNLLGLQDLQALKLRGVGMRDGEAEVLANAISTRVRLLDIRDNYLTDMAVRSLMQACFLTTEASRIQSNGNGRLDDWPVGLPPGPDFLSLDALRSEDLDEQLLRQLTNPLTGRLAFEDIPHKGLTHLYISGNNLSVEGLSSLLKSNRLHVIDGGSVDTIRTVTRTRSTSSPHRHIDRIQFPGSEKLIPILSDDAGRKLTYVRLNHAIVTAKPPVKEKEVVLPAVPTVPTVTAVTAVPVNAIELPNSQAPQELSASRHHPVEAPVQEVFELSADPPEPRAELPGDIIHFALSPPIGEAPIEPPEPDVPIPRRGSGAFAPEPVVSPVQPLESENGTIPADQAENEDDDEEIVLDATGSGLSARRRARMQSLSSNPTSILSPVTPMTPIAQILQPTQSSQPTQVVQSTQPPQPSQPPSTPSTFHQAWINKLLQKRPTNAPPSPAPAPDPAATVSTTSALELPALHPSFLPHLQTLVLTDVPNKVPVSSPIPEALKTYVSACADEAYLSLLLAQTNYSLPPGRSRTEAEIRHAKTLFALEKIVLEMELPSSGSGERKRGGPWHHTRERNSFSKSSTGDRDSEALWSAAAGDFSFFGEEGEAEDECGIYRTDHSKYDFASLGSDGMIAVGDEEDQASNGWDSTTTLSSTDGLSRRNTRTGRSRGVSTPSTPVLPANGSASSTLTARAANLRAAQTTSEPSEPLVDVISVLSSFRKAKKAEFEAALAAQYSQSSMMNSTINPITADTVIEQDLPFIPGYWAGEIKVIRTAPYVPPPGSPHNRQPSLPSTSNNTTTTNNNNNIRPSHQAHPQSSVPLHLRQPPRPFSFNSGTMVSTPPMSPVSPISPIMPRRHDSRSSRQVVRDRDMDEEGTQVVDFYGNRFEGGYLYP